MKSIYKKLGETPLEALEKFRAADASLKDEILSYIGRLDPMAEGEMMVLIGKEENQGRDRFLAFDKEYVAKFLVGFSTDTGDLLGLVKEEKNFVENIKIEALNLLCSEIVKINEQKFPWFSSKHVPGKALFDWFKSGKSHEIERPTKKIQIYECKLLEEGETSANNFWNYIQQTVGLVSGDFRQTEIIENWQKALAPYLNNSENNNQNFKTFTLKLKVSTGTYIRGLTEDIENFTGFPVVLYSLKRDKIYTE